MKLLILGGTGPTGQQVVMQAIAKGHDVTALVRTPSKLALTSGNLKVVKGDVLDKTTLLKALEGQDALVSALGVGKTLRPHHLIENAMATIVQAMSSAGVKRIVFLSAFGVGESFSNANLLQKLIFRLPLKAIYADKAKGDSMLKESPLDWTIVRPVVLTNGPTTVKYQAGEVLPMKGMPAISRADVADFMLRQLSEDTYLRKCPVIMN
jgi:uncharacterized protein YbjT (DUF2867 family)